MRVLIGVDGSAMSDGAVQLAGRLLSAEDDEILFYYSPPGTHSVQGGPLQPVQVYLSDAVFEKARQQLPEPLRKRVQTVASAREASHGLLLAGLDRQCDLIVIGARGTGPVRERSLGSLSQHVVDHATIPVLVVRCDESRATRPLHLLLASDGSQASRHASKVLNRFSWPPETSGTAITVIEPEDQHNLPEWLQVQLDDQQLAALGMGQFGCDANCEARVRQEAAKWYGDLPAIFAGHDPLVAVGHAGQEVLAAVAANRIDLVVVGARRLGPISRLLLGSTSSLVVAHAPCSVLVIRAPKER